MSGQTTSLDLFWPIHSGSEPKGFIFSGRLVLLICHRIREHTLRVPKMWALGPSSNAVLGALILGFEGIAIALGRCWNGLTYDLISCAVVLS